MVTRRRAVCLHAPVEPLDLAVLIVDDFRDAADSLAEVLRFYVRAVRVAYDAPAATVAMPADVVVVEPRLVASDGYELVRRMRATARRPFVIALSTSGCARDRRRSAAAGADLHLVKTAEPAVLVGVLRRFARAVRPALVVEPERTTASGDRRSVIGLRPDAQLVSQVNTRSRELEYQVRFDVSPGEGGRSAGWFTTEARAWQAACVRVGLRPEWPT